MAPKKKQKLKVALVQLNSIAKKDKNIKKALYYCTRASQKKVHLICFPENIIQRRTDNTIPCEPEPIPGPSTQPFMDYAKTNNVHILLGSIPEEIKGSDKVYATSVLINPEGKITATYRKIHLFDVKVKEKTIEESKLYEAGTTPTLTQINQFKTGLSICYDLRFPELYRHYSTQQAHIMTCPSSFTKPTGKVHWEALIKARAIENQCFILAPNQIGPGTGNVDTYGNSLIVGPWGNIIGRGSDDKEEIITGSLNMDMLEKVRKEFPALTHRKLT